MASTELRLLLLIYFTLSGVRAEDILLRIPTPYVENGRCQFDDVISFRILREKKPEMNVHLRHRSLGVIDSHYVMTGTQNEAVGFELRKTQALEGMIGRSEAYNNPETGGSFLISCVRNPDFGTHFAVAGSLFEDGFKYRLKPSPHPVLKADGLDHVTAKYSMTEELEASVGDDTFEDSHMWFSPVAESFRTNLFFHHLSKRQVVDYYFDILPFIDYKLYQLWRSISQTDTEAEAKIVEYLTHIFNTVDMRLQTLTIPGVRVHVRMLQPFISKTAEDSNFLVLETAPNGEQKVSAGDTLIKFQAWLGKQTGMNIGDHTMLFTGYDVFKKSLGVSSTVTKGLAFVGTFCNDDGSSCSIVQDKMAYQSELVAAHELGHSLGSVHDGEQNACKSTSRFLMADGGYPITDSNIKNPWSFSTCSSASIGAHMAALAKTGKLQSCLESKSGSATTLDDVLSLEDQCVDYYGTGSYPCRTGNPVLGKVCEVLYCRVPGTTNCDAITAATGSCCDTGKMCMGGSCVTESLSSKCFFADVNCPWGDQPGVISGGQTCSQFHPSSCYDESFRIKCCEFCKTQKTTIAGCLYGDKVTGCSSGGCGSTLQSGVPYATDCCKTCEDACQDTGKISYNGVLYSCEDLIEKEGKFMCYSAGMETACCRSCRAQASPDNDNCKYGDNLQTVDCTRLVELQATSCTQVIAAACCETCPNLTASATTAPSTEAPAEATTKGADPSTASVTISTEGSPVQATDSDCIPSLMRCGAPVTHELNCVLRLLLLLLPLCLLWLL